MRMQVRKSGLGLRLTPATALAFVAVFLLLSGSVVAAARLARGSVTTREVRDGSLSGKDVRRNSLNGREIDESKLATVPRAAQANTAQAASAAQTATTARSADRATSAADADRLAGRAAGSFASSSEVFTIAVRLAVGESRTLVERDGVRLVARCETGVKAVLDGNPITADVLSLFAEASSDGATLQSPLNLLDGSPGNGLGPGTPDNLRLAARATAVVGVRVMRPQDKPVTLSSEAGSTIFFGVGSSVRLSLNMHGAACAVTAPVMVSRFG